MLLLSAVVASHMFNRIDTAEGSDTTEADSSNTADKQIMLRDKGLKRDKELVRTYSLSLFPSFFS